MSELSNDTLEPKNETSELNRGISLLEEGIADVYVKRNIPFFKTDKVWISPAFSNEE